MVILPLSGAVGTSRVSRRQEVVDAMVRVLVVGEHPVALKPVRAALDGLPGVDTFVSSTGTRAAGADPVDAVVVDQSLGASRVMDRLDTLATTYPDACVVALSFDRADRYRWVRVLPKGADFAIRGAGTDTLEAILRDLMDDLDLTGRLGDRDHETLPTMPRSIA